MKSYKILIRAKRSRDGILTFYWVMYFDDGDCGFDFKGGGASSPQEES